MMALDFLAWLVIVLGLMVEVGAAACSGHTDVSSHKPL